jgi:hypothetical protein
MKLPLVVFITLCSYAPDLDQASGRNERTAQAPDLQCLSPERDRSCECSLKIVTLACPVSHPTGWQAHFASELNDGSPLWLNLSGREIALRSRRPVTNRFTPSRGDRWVEEYEGENLKAVIRYRPAKSTCSKEKVAAGEECEYFDVAADVLLSQAGGAARKYSAIGACGC